MALRDSIDRALLAALKENARASVTELSHQLSLSRTTVKQRLDKLIENQAIRKFTIVTDTDDDAIVRAVMTIELQGSMSRSVSRALRGLPEITALYSTNGAWDLVAEIHTDTLGEFDRVLRQVREISGVLNSETSLLLQRMR